MIRHESFNYLCSSAAEIAQLYLTNLGIQQQAHQHQQAMSNTEIVLMIRHLRQSRDWKALHKLTQGRPTPKNNLKSFSHIVHIIREHFTSGLSVAVRRSSNNFRCSWVTSSWRHIKAHPINESYCFNQASMNIHSKTFQVHFYQQKKATVWKLLWLTASREREISQQTSAFLASCCSTWNKAAVKKMRFI